MPEPGYLENGMSANFSEDRRYRYTLVRAWGSGPTIIWIMLNPSTADEKVLDPTVRRCLGYSMEWGYGRMEILNLFALRSTDPSELYSNPDPVGKQNDEWISFLCSLRYPETIIAAWGLHGTFQKRDERVTEIITKVCHKSLYCLQLTKDGTPGHPLYLKKNLKPILYRGAT